MRDSCHFIGGRHRGAYFFFLYKGTCVPLLVQLSTIQGIVLARSRVQAIEVVQ